VNRNPGPVAGADARAVSSLDSLVNNLLGPNLRSMSHRLTPIVHKKGLTVLRVFRNIVLEMPAQRGFPVFSYKHDLFLKVTSGTSSS
jgi:hypothetical protein